MKLPFLERDYSIFLSPNKRCFLKTAESYFAFGPNVQPSVFSIKSLTRIAGFISRPIASIRVMLR